MTPEQAKKLFGQMQNFAKTQSGPIVYNNLLTLEESFKKRIFKDGLNAFNSNIGDYLSKDWMMKRLEKGLQIDYVDLNYSGELKNSIDSFPKKNGAILEIKNGKNVQKANYQELLQGSKAGAGGPMDIFSPTANEISTLESDFEKQYMGYIDQILDSYL